MASSSVDKIEISSLPFGAAFGTAFAAVFAARFFATRFFGAASFFDALLASGYDGPHHQYQHLSITTNFLIWNKKQHYSGSAHVNTW